MSVESAAGLWTGLIGRACWQGGLFILGATAVCRLFPRLPAAVRCWVWWLACLKLLCALLWFAPLSLTLLPAAGPAAVGPPPAPWPTHAPLTVPVPLRAPAPAIHTRRSRIPTPSPSLSIRRPVTDAFAAAAPPVPRHSRLPEALLAAWLAGLAWRVAGMGRQWRAARRLARAARPLEDAAVEEQAAALAGALGLRSRPPLRAAAEAPGPLVLGFLQPTILLPPALASRLSPEELRLALAHELAHVARGDLWISLVPTLAQSLFFFHPLVGLACREWATAREAACDAAALALTGAPAPTYGRLLLKLASAARGPSIASALGASLRADTLHRRIALLRHFSPPSHRRLRAGLALLAALAILGLVPWRLTAAEPEPRERAVLAGVPGLEKPVTYEEPKIPLGELVQKVAADTGVALTAAPEVADEPVTVAVRDYPARELLEQVADLLDYQWSRRSQRPMPRTQRPVLVYEIYQDVASKQREEALRRAALAGIEQRFREQLAETVAMASRPPEEIDRILDEEVKRDEAYRQMTPDQKQAAREAAQHPSPEEQERSRLAHLAGAVDSPLPRALALLVGRLSEAQWASLWTEHRLTFSTDPQPGELRLPAETAETFRNSRPATNSRLYGWAQERMPDINEVRIRQAAMMRRWDAATGYRATIHLKADRFDMNTPIELNADVVPLHRGAPASEGGFWGVSNFFFVHGRVGLNNTPPEVDSPERRAQLDKDPVVGVKKPYRPSAKAHVDALGPDSGTMYARRDLLPGLARAYGVQIIADAYWKSSGLIGSEFAGTSAPTPLYALLDRWSHIQAWDRRDHLIRLRSRTWFFDRPREIPLRLVRRWQGLIEQKGALPLEEYTAIATGLTDAQRDGLFDLGMQVGLPDELRALQWDPFTLQLYAALTSTQRQALWRGAAIPVARMTPAARALFQEGLEMVQTRGTAWNPEELATARFSMHAEPMLRIVPAHGGASKERLEPAPAAGTAAAVVESATAARPLASGASEPSREKRYPVLRLSFQFQVGGEKPSVWPLTVAVPDRS